ncbi:hypothetical protein Bccel_3354 [Pseudobacteroides cellulosolvens ATCC 35603 = DSM 2933]|uniref:ATPase, P-type (Transporting), HAD superfamily, subfamily IC n=1 Tax=Pseudobacteroides cellulosolvens ATCC 35603 = DSM 2933 TaxID=398512 RepID=A0A0L6JQM2_9FIRM|nr:hypothetical protein Bccel_3354 [Pseudobacteroides cellulosolvens ATCC 35603 = DSM 2933]
MRSIPTAIRLSKKTMGKIKQNLFWAFIYNIIGIPFAALGLLSPVLAGGAMAFSSVSVVTNSLSLKRFKVHNNSGTSETKSSKSGGILAFILILIIVAGGLYLGYHYIYNRNSTGTMAEHATTKGLSNHAGVSKTANQEKQVNSVPNDEAKQDYSQSTSPITTGNNNQSHNYLSNNGAEYTAQVEIVLKNKDSLVKAKNKLNEALKLITMDPNAPDLEKQAAATEMADMGTTYDQNKMTRLHESLSKE